MSKYIKKFIKLLTYLYQKLEQYSLRLDIDKRYFSKQTKLV